MYRLLLPQGVKGLKGDMGIFKNQLHEIRTVRPAVVFFEKSVLKNFRKFLEKYS